MLRCLLSEVMFMNASRLIRESLQKEMAPGIKPPTLA